MSQASPLDLVVHMLSGKSAIVTGSTSGIGLGIARGLAANGANIMLNGFGDPNEIEAIREDIANGHNIKVVYSNANMADGNDIGGMMALAEEEFGGVDILVNNAGFNMSRRSRIFPSRSGTPFWRSISRAPSMPAVSRSPG